MGKTDVWRIPTLIHHWRIFLPGWLEKGKDLTIIAPPPPHFTKESFSIDIIDIDNYG